MKVGSHYGSGIKDLTKLKAIGHFRAVCELTIQHNQEKWDEPASTGLDSEDWYFEQRGWSYRQAQRLAQSVTLVWRLCRPSQHDRSHGHKSL